jgi:tripartite-type tricarboxylate transporter receptor subunit TctC
MMRRQIVGFLVATSMSCYAVTASMAASDDVETFYKENTIRLAVPWSAGGGTDFAARIWAAFWPDATDGTVRVKNITGADGHLGLSEMYNAKPDGLTLGLTSYFQVPYDDISEHPAKRYEAEKFQYIGWFGYEPYLFSIVTKSDYKTVDDLKKASGLICASGGGEMNQACATIIAALDLDAKVVIYPGTADAVLAAARGEIDMLPAPAATLKEFVDKGYLQAPLAHMSFKSGSLYPDVPPLPDLVKLTTAGNDAFKVWGLLFGGRTVLTGPKVPPEKVAYLRKAFAKLMGLKGFKRTAKKRFGPTEPFKSGEEIQALTIELMSMDPAITANFVKIMNSKLKK